ncbi:MAG: hypothetical protein HFH69_04535 [Lachnospiraceae bacterium]|nr:hypothetical protein [Lachnospiraceae bacterium]
MQHNDYYVTEYFWHLPKSMPKKYQGTTPWKLATCDFTGVSSLPIKKGSTKRHFYKRGLAGIPGLL